MINKKELNEEQMNQVNGGNLDEVKWYCYSCHERHIDEVYHESWNEYKGHRYCNNCYNKIVKK